jgi:hypothetical protein
VVGGRRDVPCSVEERIAGAEVALVALDRAWRRLTPPDDELEARRGDLHDAWDVVVERRDRWDDDGEARGWRRVSDAALVLSLAVAASSTSVSTELLESATELCERVQAVLDRLELDRSFHAIVGGLRRVDGP